MNLLERTRRLLQGLTPASPPKAQHYNVTCPEGHGLRGERTEGYQALRCPTCGEGIFVLPRSPLPEPVAPESAQESSAARVPTEADRDDGPIRLTDPVNSSPHEDLEVDADAEIEWVDPDPVANSSHDRRQDRPPSRLKSAEDSDFFENLDVEEEPAADPDPAHGPQPKRPRTPRSTQAEPKARPRAAGLKRSASERPTPQVAVAPRKSIADWARRYRNPLIFLAVALIVIGTIGRRLGTSKFQDLPRVVEIGREKGLAALDEGDFDTAHQLLSDAKRAVDALGGAVEGAAEIRHGAEEVAIYSSLVPESLEYILGEASADAEEWSSRFKTFYQGRSIILDDVIRKTPNAANGGSYDLYYRVLPHGEGARPNLRIGRVDFTGFRLFELASPKLGDRIQIGARLASFNYDRDSKEWVIRLEPDSGVFLTHPKALEAIGRPLADEATGEQSP